jgi:hypothetical protein
VGDHQFNVRWLGEACRILRPGGTIWVTGTHHIIFSLGFALQTMKLKLIKHICTRIFRNLSLKRSVRFSNTYRLSMWDEPVGSRADEFRRSPFARSSHLATAEFGFPVLVGVGLFIAHAPDIGVRYRCPNPSPSALASQ